VSEPTQEDGLAGQIAQIEAQRKARQANQKADAALQDARSWFETAKESTHLGELKAEQIIRERIKTRDEKEAKEKAAAKAKAQSGAGGKQQEPRDIMAPPTSLSSKDPGRVDPSALPGGALGGSAAQQILSQMVSGQGSPQGSEAMPQGGGGIPQTVRSTQTTTGIGQGRGFGGRSIFFPDVQTRTSERDITPAERESALLSRQRRLVGAEDRDLQKRLLVAQVTKAEADAEVAQASSRVTVSRADLIYARLQTDSAGGVPSIAANSRSSSVLLDPDTGTLKYGPALVSALKEVKTDRNRIYANNGRDWTRGDHLRVGQDSYDTGLLIIDESQTQEDSAGNEFAVHTYSTESRDTIVELFKIISSPSAPIADAEEAVKQLKFKGFVFDRDGNIQAPRDDNEQLFQHVIDTERALGNLKFAVRPQLAKESGQPGPLSGLFITREREEQFKQAREELVNPIEAITAANFKIVSQQATSAQQKAIAEIDEVLSGPTE
tara:strand:+ start:2133 stop:3614 length:1482 start_codon:yes stop_codon:yes gene_type:complete